MTAPEFSRPERLDTIGAGERAVTISASEDERRRLSGRFALVGIDALDAELAVHREAAGVRVSGRVRATVTQACSVTGEPIAAAVDEPVDLLFVAPGQASEEEVELDDAAIDVIEHDGAAIDLGEVAAETMALALDPFPRGPNADAAVREAGLLDEGAAGPFGALSQLLKPAG